MGIMSFKLILILNFNKNPVDINVYLKTMTYFSFMINLELLGKKIPKNVLKTNKLKQIKTNLYAFCSSTFPQLFPNSYLTFLFLDYSFLQLLRKERNGKERKGKEKLRKERVEEKKESRKRNVQRIELIF
ncbi:hypothetical protein BpHYR1_032578 [Brachionus plicatilis]|uniref:Uncharacterized protein n=1 Tax=Brachionus plicatilis TaxID=10195 RepID=A0A3M7R3M5_BRAPC|nr:hypothetical protein BpHYR1_032578 [Brachionus plicatilis]